MKPKVMIALALSAVVMLAASTAQAQQPPNCPYGLEPGGGPMRCANPDDPHSVLNRPNAYLFAYVPLKAGNAVDRICWAYVPPEDTHQEDRLIFDYERPDGARGFIATWSYDVDASQHTLTITSIRAWNGRMWGDPHSVHIVVPLYEQPQPGWPCSRETWMAMLDIPEPAQPGGGGYYGGTVPNAPVYRLPRMPECYNGPTHMPGWNSRDCH